MAKKKDRTVTITTSSPAYGGSAIGRIDGKVVMVTGAIPGETVVARIDEDKKDYSTATAVDIVEPSPDRVPPGCPHYGVCGGCNFQHISYERQVAVKQEVLADCLRRAARLEVGSSPPLTGEPWGYRVRGQFKFSPGSAGFYRLRTRDVVDIESCPVMGRDVNRMFSAARRALEGMDVKEAHITCGEPPVVLVRPGGGDWRAIADRLVEAGFGGVCVQPGKGNAEVFGGGHTSFDLDGLTYTLSPMSFVQGNWRLNNELVRLVVDGLMPLAGKRVLDLYSGAGNFSLAMARAGASVEAVEENPYAVKDGERSAGLNGTTDVRFRCVSADRVEIPAGLDALVVDPPRPGLTNAAMNAVLEAAPSRIVYVSCNPSTFARDLRKLSAKYEVESVRLVDFFPQTAHIEAVAFLSLSRPTPSGS